MLSPQSLEVAHALIRDRLQQAARDALADQFRAASSARPTPTSLGLSSATRRRLASSLRDLAARLDPSVGRDPPVVALKAR